MGRQWSPAHGNQDHSCRRHFRRRCCPAHFLSVSGSRFRKTWSGSGCGQHRRKCSSRSQGDDAPVGPIANMVYSTQEVRQKRRSGAKSVEPDRRQALRSSWSSCECFIPGLARPDSDSWHVRSSDDVLRWLACAEAGLFPRREWIAGITEAAIVAILCKLLRNKSWNANVQGHQWTKEADLLNQAPVQRAALPSVAIEARRILNSLSSSILLTKGAGQGKTPKEWSINTRFLPEIKRAILRGDIQELSGVASFQGILQRIERQERSVSLVGEIVTERVYAVCRS